MTEHSLNISFSPQSERSADPYWLRIEVVKKDDTQMTVGEAADFIDTLYNTSVCGREYEQPQKLEIKEDPTPDKWQQALARLQLPSCEALAAMKNDPGAYDTQLKVYRSHQGETYKMLLSNGDINSVTRVEEAVVLTLDVEGQSQITLEMPILRSPVIAWQGIDGPDIRIIGNTLYWDEVFTGVLRAEFTTVYDLIDVHVHGTKNEDSEIVTGTDGKWLGTGWYSGDEDGTELLDAKDVECTLLAFYHYQFETVTLHKPEIDESVSIDKLMAICEWEYNVPSPGGSDFGNSGKCYKYTKAIEICECGGSRKKIIKKVKAPCPPGVNSGTTINKKKAEPVGFDFVDCGGNPDDVDELWFYEDKCCRGWNENAEDLLPKCKELHGLYIGNCQPDEEHLKELYGDDAQIIMVGAKEGACGEMIITQDTAGKSCCDGVSGLSWDADNSAGEITRDSTGLVHVEGGRLPLFVSVRGKGFSLDGDGMRDGEINGNWITIHAGPDSCGAAKVTVSDGCSTCNGAVLSPEGSWSELPPIDQHDCPVSGSAEWGGSTLDVIQGGLKLEEKPQGSTDWHPTMTCNRCRSSGISFCNPTVWFSTRCETCTAYTCETEPLPSPEGCSANSSFTNDSGVTCASNFTASGQYMCAGDVDGLFIGDGSLANSVSSHENGYVSNYVRLDKNTEKTLYQWSC